MAEPILSVANICKNFGALAASKDVSLDLRPGEIHALIGPNGAGKSTLIKQIAGWLRPDAGQIRFLGKDVTALDTVQRAKMGLARTFQISALAMADTVLENAILGALGAHGQPYKFLFPVLRRADLRDIAETALERVGLSDHAHMRTSDLSHGQRRQLEVAVALTMKPRAFVMDEPMAGLGASGSKRLVHFLDELRHEAPILLIEHDMDAIFALSDRVTVLVYGSVIATGTVDEIRADSEVRRAYLGEDG